MSWVRLDDRGAFHHKVMRAGNAAYGVWCRCLQMCGLNDSCGFVPRELALAIAGPDTSTIDRLTEGTLTAGASLPFWDPSNGADRRASITALAALLQELLTSGGGMVSIGMMPGAEIGRAHV